MIVITILCFWAIIATYYTAYYRGQSQRYIVALNECREHSELKAYEELEARYEELNSRYEELKARYEGYEKPKAYEELEARYEELNSRYEELNSRYEELKAMYEPLVTRVNICIDYGNGTRVWHNDTLVPLSSNLLNATNQMVDVNYAVGAYGCIVESIDGIPNNQAKGYFWVWWFWDDKKLEWDHLGMAPDRYLVEPGNIICWYYQYALEYPLKPPEIIAQQ